jgi:hypothetical protein
VVFADFGEYSPLMILTTIYKTIIQRHIDHCITIWRYDPKCQIQRVERLQNKIFRLITRDYSWNTSPSGTLSRFNGINVYYRCLNDSFPTYMSGILIHVILFLNFTITINFIYAYITSCNFYISTTSFYVCN